MIQRNNNVIMTSKLRIKSSWRQNNVATSFWHHNDVIIASCAIGWVTSTTLKPQQIKTTTWPCTRDVHCQGGGEWKLFEISRARTKLSPPRVSYHETLLNVRGDGMLYIIFDLILSCLMYWVYDSEKKVIMRQIPGIKGRLGNNLHVCSVM